MTAISSGRAGAYLYACMASRGQDAITSAEISALTGIGAPQVRRDLEDLFGKIGTPGLGFSREQLQASLRRRAAGQTTAGARLIAHERALPTPLNDSSKLGISSRIAQLMREGAAVAAEIDALLDGATNGVHA